MSLLFQKFPTADKLQRSRQFRFESSGSQIRKKNTLFQDDMTVVVWNIEDWGPICTSKIGNGRWFIQELYKPSFCLLSLLMCLKSYSLSMNFLLKFYFHTHLQIISHIVQMKKGLSHRNKYYWLYLVQFLYLSPGESGIFH